MYDNADSDDNFDVGVDGQDLFINSVLGSDRLRDFPGAGFAGSTDRKVDFTAFGDAVTGKVFDFYTGEDITKKGFKNLNDDYVIRGVKVAVDVPEPATMLGLGAVAAAGLLVQKRSRKEAA